MELKLKKCLKRGYWISVHRFKASTMKVSFNPLLTRCDFVMMDVLNESGTKIPWKVDYLFSAAVLKLKKCLKSGYWFSVLRFKASTMKVSLKHLLTRCDFVMMDVLNESGTKIPWKVDYLFTAVELKLKKCLKRRIQLFCTSIQVLAQWNNRNNTCWPDVTSLCWMYWMKVVLKSLEK